MEPLSNPLVIAELDRAWKDSDAQTAGKRHEEGGYILMNSDGSLTVERWPHGEQFRIIPPPLDANNCYNGFAVVATFHTHPNPILDETGRKWEQAPGTADKRLHQRQNLRGFVISSAHVFQIDADGSVTVIGTRNEVLKP